MAEENVNKDILDLLVGTKFPAEFTAEFITWFNETYNPTDLDVMYRMLDNFYLIAIGRGDTKKVMVQYHTENGVAQCWSMMEQKEFKPDTVEDIANKLIEQIKDKMGEQSVKDICAMIKTVGATYEGVWIDMYLEAVSDVRGRDVDWVEVLSIIGIDADDLLREEASKVETAKNAGEEALIEVMDEHLDVEPIEVITSFIDGGDYSGPELIDMAEEANVNISHEDRLILKDYQINAPHKGAPIAKTWAKRRN